MARMSTPTYFEGQITGTNKDRMLVNCLVDLTGAYKIFPSLKNGNWAAALGSGAMA